ncbi:MAG TPA: methylated-DNA--[protein]-cysteine S-methyltransferase [Actinomycetota bacterium]|nr:methylated-DNA--[protein]-cysteine S-methyltransferase [Actinomycetota bacterium]
MAMTQVQTPIGLLTVVAGAAGVQQILFDGQPPPTGASDEPAGAVLDEAAAQLRQYFAGDRTSFDFPIDLRGTAFQQKAWLALATIPFGETISYGEQARRVGRPTAARAIGAANGRNPVPIVLPCHRVIGASGALTGFGGGLDVKQALLEHERRVGAGS